MMRSASSSSGRNISGRRGERAQHGQIAHAGAEVALQRPERGDHRPRHAVLLLDLGEQLAMLLELRRAGLEPVLRDQLACKRREALGEEALLAVTRDDPRIHGHAVESGREGCARDAVRSRLLAEVRQPPLEAARVLAVGVGGGTLGRFGRWRSATCTGEQDHYRCQRRCRLAHEGRLPMQSEGHGSGGK